MDLPRIVDRCIVCLKSPPGSNVGFFCSEHVIPKALGGVLTTSSLCKSCNDQFGHTFETKAKFDPAIRLAIHALKSALPDLFARIEEGQKYVLSANGVRLPGVFRSGEVRAQTLRLNDSLWAANHDAERIVRGMLNKAGVSSSEIENSWRHYLSSPEGEPVDMGGAVVAISQPTFEIGPDFTSGETLTPLVALKTAYEFSVLSFGAAMLEDKPPLNDIRRTLLEGDASSPCFNVEAMITQDRTYEPFHGIAFEGNKPHAVIQVRLFGSLAYRVHFTALAIDFRPFGYCHDLNTGEEAMAFRDP